MDYKAAIGYLFLVQDRIQGVDVNGLFEYCYPKLAAPENDIIEWENRNNAFLPDQYKDFLMAANGWESVNQDKSLFGLNDLSLSSDSKFVKLRDLSLDLISNYGAKEYLLPVGAAQYSNDLYLLVLDKDSPFYGEVIWTAGEEIDRYENFDEFFLSLIEYNKLTYKMFTGMDYTE